jgi:hypothetical protein
MKPSPIASAEGHTISVFVSRTIWRYVTNKAWNRSLRQLLPASLTSREGSLSIAEDEQSIGETGAKTDPSRQTLRRGQWPSQRAYNVCCGDTHALHAAREDADTKRIHTKNVHQSTHSIQPRPKQGKAMDIPIARVPPFMRPRPVMCSQNIAPR